MGQSFFYFYFLQNWLKIAIYSYQKEIIECTIGKF